MMGLSCVAGRMVIRRVVNVGVGGDAGRVGVWWRVARASWWRGSGHGVDGARGGALFTDAVGCAWSSDPSWWARPSTTHTIRCVARMR